MGTRKTRSLIAVAGVYLALWALTWTWGVSDVDNNFDAEFSMGCSQLGQRATEPVVRIDKLNARELDDPGNEYPDAPWRYRSTGIAVAPFVILDEAAWVTAPLGGFGGRRVVFWFFGKTVWFPYWCHWMV